MENKKSTTTTENLVITAYTGGLSHKVQSIWKLSCKRKENVSCPCSVLFINTNYSILQYNILNCNQNSYSLILGVCIQDVVDFFSKYANNVCGYKKHTHCNRDIEKEQRQNNPKKKKIKKVSSPEEPRCTLQ